MKDEKKVAFVLGCVDQRHHVPEAEMIGQLKELLSVDEVYLCTTAGPDGVMVEQGCRCDAAVEDAVIIKEAKGASVFAVLGHHGCAGHPVSDEQHDDDTKKAAKLMATKVQSPVWPLIFKLGSEDRPTWVAEKLSSVPVDSLPVAAE